MATTTTNKKLTFEQPEYVPPMPNPGTTVERQKALADRYIEQWRTEIHNELDRRNGQGKPCALEVVGEFLPGSASMVTCLTENENTGIIRLHFVQTVVKASVEFFEYDLAQTA